MISTFFDDVNLGNSDVTFSLPAANKHHPILMECMTSSALI